ncbi:MAG TPA: helix-hairpin-helix domain-containing protein [Candidatus Xenobia bacterium]|nr:helix-hairpin-helix domain-containing protein [Candidatus Xenobia bacterium]
MFSRPFQWVFLLLGLLFFPAVLRAEESKAPQPKTNINTATVEDLAKLPGIGEVIAKRIVSHREKSGKFRKVEELLVIRGISKKKLEKLRPLITVGEEETED